MLGLKYFAILSALFLQLLKGKIRKNHETLSFVPLPKFNEGKPLALKSNLKGRSFKDINDNVIFNNGKRF